MSARSDQVHISRYVVLALFVALSECQRAHREVEIESLTGSYNLSEGPHWDEHTKKLYFVDLNGQTIYNLDPVTKELHHAYIAQGPVGVVVPVKGTTNKLVAGIGTQVMLVTWDGKTDTENPPVETLATLEESQKGPTRINDGKADASNRFWFGTMAREVGNYIASDRGSFYSMDSQRKVKMEIPTVSISNGLAWNKKDDTLYYIDSLANQVWGFDYDHRTANISNKRVVFDLRANNITGSPDGMTIDSDDNLWVAVYGGHAVLNIDPRTGEIIRTVKMPARDITSVTFGGPHYDILFVTSAKQSLTPEEFAQQPNAGSVFAVKNLGVHGLPAHEVKL